jgi:hypothetical protein
MKYDSKENNHDLGYHDRNQGTIEIVFVGLWARTSFPKLDNFLPS